MKYATEPAYADYLEDMSIADYFQTKLNMREQLSDIAPAQFTQPVNNLVKAMEHTENLEEKSGVLNPNGLRTMHKDIELLLEMLSEPSLRRAEIRELIMRIEMQQTLQQEAIRQEMENLRTVLLQSKEIIEKFALQPRVSEEGPTLDPPLMKSKVYQFITAADSTRRDLADNIAKVRAAISSKKENAIAAVKEFAQIPVKTAASFFSKIKDVAATLKNKLYYAAEEIRKPVTAVKQRSIEFVSDSLDSAAAVMLDIRNHINGTTPEQMEKQWEARNYLSDYIKEMLEKHTPEKMIMKSVKEFCSANGLGESGVMEAKYWMNTYFKQIGLQAGAAR